MARRLLRDAQVEIPYLNSRWLLDEPAGHSYVYDDFGGLVLPTTGSPVLGSPSMIRGDSFTSAVGGYTSQINDFSAAISGFTFASGVTIEGVTTAALSGSFYLFNAPGQAQLEISSGGSVSFGVYAVGPTLHTLTASSVLLGPPQLVQGTYDSVANIQAIYVDGVEVASQALTITVNEDTTGNTQLLQPASNVATVAQGQDVAIYDGALPPNRITEHFAAFMQQWLDPGHVMTYPYIAVAAD